MGMELLATIRTHYQSLTPVERDIADFVLAHGDEVVYMPISELAYRCSVGEASIVRFCRRMNQPGYQAFRLEMASALEALRLQTVVRAPLSSDPYERALNETYQKHLSALENTHRTLLGNGFQNVVEHLLNACQVYFFGMDQSFGAALFACQSLLSTIQKGRFTGESSLQLLQASTLTAEDTAVFLSHCGRSEELLKICRAVKDCGAYTIAVTCCGEAPLNRLCDQSLYCSCNRDPANPTFLDTVTGKSSIAYAVEALCAACASLTARAEPVQAVWRVRSASN